MIKHSGLHADLTEKIIGAYYKVYNTLGTGFLEKIYREAMLIELGKLNLAVQKDFPISVMYEGHNIGNFFADIVVNNKVILELKAVASLHPAHEAQLGNYLRATPIELGLLLNFGDKSAIKRMIFTNDRKK
ncbi:MAG: hypothetical protein RLZZ628_1864 [Bacteroidota bacterium]|jgi:GxxExxY protein